MNKSSRQYQRGLTTNSFNQDFIYYKYSKQLQKSPKMKKHAISYQEHQKTNHVKIQSMKNTLNLLIQPHSKSFVKSFNKSVMDLPTDNKRKSEVLKQTKSVHEKSTENFNYNNKLFSLTQKLREIALKKHFSSTQDSNKKEKTKRVVCKTSQDAYVNNMELILKKNLLNEQTRLEEFIAKETNMILQKEKDGKKLNNYSQQLVKSKSRGSGSFVNNQFLNENSQSYSLKRQPKNSKTDKTINSFNFSEEMQNDFEFSQRPRGKTVANFVNEPIINEMQATKIKINTFLEKKEPSKRLSQKSAAAIVQKMHNSLVPSVLNILQPHRGPITSIIINSDGKRFLTASNDYTIKESTLQGTYTVLRKHQGRVNVMRMIDDKLYSGGNDCKLKFEKGSFTFQSPVVQIYPEQKQHINVGTSSSIQMFNIVKKVSTKTIEIKSKWYKIFQKVNKEIYVVDNHNLSIVDWRVPFPLINLSQQPNFVEDWISDPYSLNFYQVKDKKIIQIGIRTNNLAQKMQQHIFGQDIKDYCWKKDKAYFLTQSEVQIFENSRNYLHKKTSFSLNLSQSLPCKLQIKNDICIYGMLDGKLVVKKFN